MIQSASVVAFVITSIWYLTFDPSRIFIQYFLYVYKYYVLEVHFVTHFHNAFKWRYIMFYGMFHLTWITFRFSRNQLGTVVH